MMTIKTTEEEPAMKPSLNIPGIFLVITLVIALSSVGVQAADLKAPPPSKHAYGHAALSRASSGYKREVIADPKARDGQAVRFTGEAGFFISMHDEIRTAPGRNRFTVRLRLEKGGFLATHLEAGGKGFQSRVPLEFTDLPADGSYTERTVELNLPGDLNVVSLRDGLPSTLIVDRIEEADHDAMIRRMKQ
jgi:hypothetical protein